MQYNSDIYENLTCKQLP